MAENQAPTGTSAPDEAVPELDDAQLRQLTDIVYRLIRDDAILQQERRGSTQQMDRR